MGCAVASCDECTRNCLLIHGKNKDPSCVVTSFFKVLVADNSSKVLFLPPTFVRRVPDLMDKETELENAVGQRWKVTISKCDGSLAFQQGWHAFYVEHALEFGDFVVFHYIMGSHFVVQIYGKSGCEKLKVSHENGHRKKRAHRHSGAKGGKDHSIDGDSMNKQAPSASALSGSNVGISQGQAVVTDDTLNVDTVSGRIQLSPRTEFPEENGGEKLSFSAENGTPKKRATRLSGAKGGKDHSIDGNSMSKQAPSTSALSGSNVEISQSQAMVTNNTLSIDNARESPEENGKSRSKKLKFSEENVSRKKSRTNRQSSAKDGKDRSIGSDSMNKQVPSTSGLYGSNVEMNRSPARVTDSTLNSDNANGRVQLSTRTKLPEEPFDMIDRDPRHRHEGATTRALEMPKSHARANIVDKIPVNEVVVSSLALSDVPNLEFPGRNEDFQTMENVVFVSEKDSSNGNARGQEQRKKQISSNIQDLTSQKEDPSLMHSSHNAHQIFAGKSEFRGLPASVQAKNFQSGERMKVVKTKKVEMRKEFGGFKAMVNGTYPETKVGDQSFSHAIKEKDHLFEVVKTEPVDILELSSADTNQIEELSSADAANISLIVTDRQPFVELPMCLPSVAFRGRPPQTARKVVVLRDPESRLWPVLYHWKYGLHVLTSGWEAFVKANRIRPGDECAFEVVKDAFECIYKVGIVRNET